MQFISVEDQAEAKSVWVMDLFKSLTVQIRSGYRLTQVRAVIVNYDGFSSLPGGLFISPLYFRLLAPCYWGVRVGVSKDLLQLVTMHL